MAEICQRRTISVSRQKRGRNRCFPARAAYRFPDLRPPTSRAGGSRNRSLPDGARTGRKRDLPATGQLRSGRPRIPERRVVADLRNLPAAHWFGCRGRRCFSPPTGVGRRRGGQRLPVTRIRLPCHPRVGQLASWNRPPNRPLRRCFGPSAGPGRRCRRRRRRSAPRPVFVRPGSAPGPLRGPNSCPVRQS